MPKTLWLSYWHLFTNRTGGNSEMLNQCAVQMRNGFYCCLHCSIWFPNEFCTWWQLCARSTSRAIEQPLSAQTFPVTHELLPKEFTRVLPPLIIIIFLSLFWSHTFTAQKLRLYRHWIRMAQCCITRPCMVRVVGWESNSGDIQWFVCVFPSC